jgi:hypothetical protein
MPPCDADEQRHRDGARSGVPRGGLAQAVPRVAPIQRLISMLLLAALSTLAGCASTAPSAASTPASTVEPSGVESTLASRCPPPTAGRPLERDLTVPFRQRGYLLDTGALCTPRPYPALPVGGIAEPTTPASAEPTRRGGSP